MENGKLKFQSHIMDMGNDMYHGHPALSSSQLKLAYRNIEMFKRSVIDKAIPSRVSAAMTTGTLFHEMVLEPRKFKPLVYPEMKIDKRKKEFKNFLKENPDADPETILSIGDLRKLESMEVNLYNHPDCPDFSKLVNESSVFYSWEGQSLRTRPDAMCTKRQVIFDLKTTSKSLDKMDFLRHADVLDYDLSAAMYIHSMYALTGQPWDFCFVVSQSVEPYSSCMYWVGESLFHQGFNKYTRALANVRNAENNNDYMFQKNAEVLETYRPVEISREVPYYRGKKQLKIEVNK